MINPVSQSSADDQLKITYERIRTMFKTDQVPLFFQYLGNFPAYLDYILDPLEANAESRQFQELQHGMSDQMIKLIHISLPESEKRIEWLERYRLSPAFYNFQQSLEQIYSLNLTFAILFIALREAVKGWAVAAKQLTPQTTSGSVNLQEREVELAHDTQDFVLEGFGVESSRNNAERRTSVSSNRDLVEIKNSSAQDEMKGDAIVVAEESGVEKNLYIDYLKLNQREFFMLTRQTDYLLLRVKAEEALLRSIHYLPHPIISPINQVFNLTADSKDYPDLLYLLSEHFPVLSVQRMLFSGYMISD